MLAALLSLKYNARNVRVTGAQFTADGRRLYADCTEQWPEPSDIWSRGYTILVLLCTYLLPLSVLSATYGLICCRLWRQTMPGNADDTRDLQQFKAKKKVP